NEHIINGLAKFQGVGRRFERHGEYTRGDGQFTLVDDYGHHPTEVKATIEAVRAGWPMCRLVMVYQPHRYSRTLELFDQFVDVLASVDHLLLLDVYSAGEAVIPGATGEDLYKAIERKKLVEIEYLENIDEVPARLDEIVRAGDFLLTQGAGATAQLAKNLTLHWQDARVKS
ncbi:MAG: UDP-N-acetylmuramate--alanine ligase, partial [Saprospiraceae bacterium]